MTDPTAGAKRAVQAMIAFLHDRDIHIPALPLYAFDELCKTVDTATACPQLVDVAKWVRRNVKCLCADGNSCVACKARAAIAAHEKGGEA